jgi:tyrosyl-tRNA synthetase
MNLLQDLKWRGLIYDVIDEEALDKRLQEGPISSIMRSSKALEKTLL